MSIGLDPNTSPLEKAPAEGKLPDWLTNWMKPAQVTSKLSTMSPTGQQGQATPEQMLNNKNYGSGGKGGDFGPYTTEAGKRIGLEAAPSMPPIGLPGGKPAASQVPAPATQQTSAVAPGLGVQQPASAVQAGTNPVEAGGGTDEYGAALKERSMAALRQGAPREAEQMYDQGMPVYSPQEMIARNQGRQQQYNQNANAYEDYMKTQSHIGLQGAQAGHLGAESENIRNPGLALTSAFDAYGRATPKQIENKQASGGLPIQPVGEAPLESGQPYSRDNKAAYLAMPPNKEFAAHLATFDPANPLPWFQKAQTFPGATTPGHGYNEIIQDMYDEAYATNPIARAKHHGQFWNLSDSLSSGLSGLTGQPSAQQQLSALLHRHHIGATPRYLQNRNTQQPLPGVSSGGPQ